MTNELIEALERATGDVPRCSDFDEDCEGLDYVHCWLYDPAKGYCPYLRARQTGEGHD